MHVQHSHKICYLRQIRYSFHVGECSNKVKRSKRRSVNRSFYRRRELFHVDNTVEQVESFHIWSSVIERNVFTSYALVFPLICCSLSNSRIHGNYNEEHSCHVIRLGDSSNSNGLHDCARISRSSSHAHLLQIL